MNLTELGYHDENKRDQRLDWLRGYAIFAMIVDHTPVTSSLFYYFTGRGIFFISAAEVFYFISGTVLGIISSRNSLEKSIHRVLRRTFELYLASIGLALFFIFLALSTHLNLWQSEQELLPNQTKLLQYLVSIFTLKSSFHGSSILVLYVLFMAISPIALWACFKGKSWLLVAVSSATYLMGYFFPSQMPYNFGVFNNPATWQFLFFLGMVIGFNREKIKTSLSLRIWNRLAFFSILLSLLLTILYVFQQSIWQSLPKFLEAREVLAWPRLMIVLVFLAGFYALLTFFWKPLNASLGWIMLPLGRNSLWSFLTHWAVIVIVINLPGYQNYTNKIIGTSWQLLALGITFGLVRILMRVKSGTVKIKVIHWSIPFSLSKLFSSGLVIIFLLIAVLLDHSQHFYTVDDRSLAWDWNRMIHEKDNNAFRTTLHVGNHPQSNAIFNFNGTGVEVYAWKGPSGGAMTVFVDDKEMAIVDLGGFPSSLYQQKVFQIKDLCKGDHQIRLDSNTSAWMKIDYLVIFK